MEIYMTRNATTRNGLVPLWEQLLRCTRYTDIMLKIYHLHGIFWRPMHLLTQLLTLPLPLPLPPPPPPSPSSPPPTQSPSRQTLAIAAHDTQMNNENNENNEIAASLAKNGHGPSTSAIEPIRVVHLIETSYSETECCYQLIRTTKTKTNIDRNTINTIEILRGPRVHATDTAPQNETHF